ncbi:MAG: energy-coupling factor transporter transmembrane component T family protein [Spirochaetota bacterium]
MPGKSEFGFNLKIGIGQYIPSHSPVHRTDPRVKISLTVLLVGASVICTSLVSLTILLIAVVGVVLAARIRLWLALGAVKPVLPFLIVLALIQMFAVPGLHEGASVIWKWEVFRLTDKSLLAGLLLIYRFVVIVTGLSVASFSTTTTQLTHGIDQLLGPMQWVGFPAHELAMVVTISIRFVPILAQEAERLMKAQASRGAYFGGRRINFLQRFRRMLPLLVPLFIVSLQHAQNLAQAMEARCYMGDRGRTSLVKLHAELWDYIALISGICLVSGVLVINYLHIDYSVWSLIYRAVFHI